MKQTREVGVVLVCDADGMITEVLVDDHEMLGKKVISRSLAAIFDRGSLVKALNFIAEIKSRGAAFDWQLNTAVGDSPTVMNFTGILWNQGILIVGAKTSDKIEALMDELIQIGNEQINQLRTAIKENTIRGKEKVKLEAELYDELGKLNNELANLQRELSKKNAELEKLNDEKNRFLGMAAHDLRNPLYAIQMYSEFLMSEASSQLSQEHCQFVEIIHSSSQFMLKLVNDLLDVAKIESGKLELDVAPADLVALVEKNVSMNNLLSSRKSITVLAQTNGNIPAVSLDSAKVEQTLNNLISNAVKFSNPGSCVYVELSSTETEVVISVRDEGPGIPEQELGKLFQPFGRISVRSTAGEDSTGLGLAIVKKIVNGHNGRVWVESKLGGGSTFFIALPVR